MKTHVIIAVAVFCSLMLGDQFHLSPRFRTVYILSMSNSLDQHLASRLTSSHVLWVVLEPTSADAVLTDSLDEDFWTWLTRTYSPPTGGAPSGNPGSALRGGEPMVKHRGTVFLVDPRKRLVLWSAYELPKNGSPSELDRSASRITNQLRVAFGKQ